MTETLSQLSDQIKKADLWFYVAAVVSFFVSLTVNGSRWRVVLRGLGQRVPLFETVFINWSSIFMGNVTPGRIGGELSRVLLLQKRCKVDVALGGVSQAYDRLTDVVPLVTMIALTLPTVKQIVAQRLPGRSSLVLGSLLVLALLLAALWLRRAPQTAAFVARWQERFARFRITRRHFLLALLASYAMWLLDLVRLILVARAVGISIEPKQALTLCVVALLGGFFPTAGGIGAVESGLTAALLLFGVKLEQALAITLLERSVSLGIGTLGGGVAMSLLGGRSLWKHLRTRKTAPAGDETRLLAADENPTAEPGKKTVTVEPYDSSGSK